MKCFRHSTAADVVAGNVYSCSDPSYKPQDEYREGPRAQTETQRAGAERQEMLLSDQGDWALAQAAHAGSIPGDTQKPAWSWATSSGWSSLSRGARTDDLQRSLPASPVPWFCDPKPTYRAHHVTLWALLHTHSHVKPKAHKVTAT